MTTSVSDQPEKFLKHSRETLPVRRSWLCINSFYIFLNLDMSVNTNPLDAVMENESSSADVENGLLPEKKKKPKRKHRKSNEPKGVPKECVLSFSNSFGMSSFIS